MGNIISLSVADRNVHYCKEKNIKKSKLFGEALELHRRMIEFSDIFNIIEFYDLYLVRIKNIERLQKEIERRNETIEALQDVLAQKEVNERRV